MIVTTERLQYLWAVAETGSFSAAGRKLGVSGAAVQQAIQAFEFDLETPLFERSSGKKPSLTPLGRKVYLQALEVIPKLKGIENHALAISQGVEPQLRIALHGFTLFEQQKQSLLALQAEFPTLEICLLDSENAALSSDHARLANKAGVEIADIIIAPASLRPDRGSNSIIFDRIKWRLYAAPNHPLAKIRGQLSTADIQQHAQLYPLPGLVCTPTLIDGMRYSPNLIHYRSFYQLNEMLIAGMGFAMFPEQLAKPLLEQGLLKALSLDSEQQEISWPVEITWSNELGVAGLWFVELFSDE